MSTVVQAARPPSPFVLDDHSRSADDGNLQGRVVEVIYKSDFDAYKAGLKTALDKDFSENANCKMKGVLYAIASLVLIVATVASLRYLRSFPANYVLPIVPALLTVTGISCSAIMGVFFFVFAVDEFKMSAFFCPSDLVDSESRKVPIRSIPK